MEAVIVQFTFLDNDIIDTYGQQVVLVLVIARGILNYLETTIKQSISQPNILYGVVTADKLNLRAYTGTPHDIWDTLESGAKVELWELRDG